MPQPRNKIIGITLGDPCGIGPEVIAKSLIKSSIQKNHAQFIIFGDHAILKFYLKKNLRNCIFINPEQAPRKKFTIGRPDRYSGQASLEYLKEACHFLRTKKIHALVTGPLSKELISSLGRKFTGHTEFLANYFNVRNFDMMFVTDNLKTVTVTRHMPLSQVNKRITTASIYKTIHLTDKALKKYFRLKNPKIAVCGLNPHAGEGGAIGNEEIVKIIPALKKARKMGIQVSGPFPADTIFYPNNARPFDAIIAMYHDQGLVAMKALYFNRLVNLTIGLPFIRTSPAHGTAFNIAGKNKADPCSMKEAIRLAIRLTQ